MHSYLRNRNIEVKNVKTFTFEKKNIAECLREVWLLMSFYFTRQMNKHKSKGNVDKFSLIKKIKLQFGESHYKKKQ